MYELLMLLRSSNICFWLSGNRILYSPYDFTERQDPSLADRRQAGIRERPRVYIRGEKRPAARPFSLPALSHQHIPKSILQHCCRQPLKTPHFRFLHPFVFFMLKKPLLPARKQPGEAATTHS